MKKLLVSALITMLLGTVAMAQLVPGPNPHLPQNPILTNPNLSQQLDIAKYDIRSTLNFLAGSSNTATQYLNDALARIESVQAQLHGGQQPPQYQSINIGDIVYKDTSYSQGAKVEGLNLQQGRATVRSVVSGNIFTEQIADLYLTKGCIQNVCVGKLAYKGTSYSQGAIIVALNQKLNKAIVKSKVSGNIFVEEIATLDIAN